jgi:hypothetical protein
LLSPNLNERMTSMRADYATSDLINKVNSDWINEVLANPELGRADAEDDIPADDVVASDLMLRPYSVQTNPLRAEPVQGPANSTRISEPSVIVEPIAQPRRLRSVTRRVTERLALAVAALAIVGVGARMAPAPQDVMNASVRATKASPELVAPINTTELRPAWLVPEILYGPAMARSPISAQRSGR